MPRVRARVGARAATRIGIRVGFRVGTRVNYGQGYPGLGSWALSELGLGLGLGLALGRCLIRIVDFLLHKAAINDIDDPLTLG